MTSRATNSQPIDELDAALRKYNEDSSEVKGGMVVDFFIGYAVLKPDNTVDYEYVVPSNAMPHQSLGLASMCMETMAADIDEDAPDV